jgi:hypothetical protein
MKTWLHSLPRRTCVSTLALSAILLSSCAMAQSNNRQDEYDNSNQVVGAQPSYPGLPHRGAKLEADIGPFKARFYGSILLNGQITDSGVFGQDLVLWPLPDGLAVTYPDGTTGRAGNNHDLTFTMRQSILGVTVNASKPLAGWTPSALVEMDFFGSRPSDTVSPGNRVFDQPRLRLAYVQMEKGSWKIVAGQDKMILSPLDPISLSHVAAPLGATAGDLWAWLPQVRADWSHKAGSTGLLFQAGVLRPQFGDPRLSDTVTAGTAVDVGSSGLGERSSQPFYQARFAISPQVNGSPATFGVSGHWGTEKIGVDRSLQSWAFAIDMNVRLERHLILRGEGFMGNNLIPFQGGIQQGAAVAGTRIQRIGAGGGWAELTILPKVGGKDAFYIGAGVDDPKNSHLLAGTTRSRNAFVWASYFRRLMDPLTLALEWSYWDFQTINIVNGAPGPRGNTGTANVVNAALAYQF